MQKFSGKSVIVTGGGKGVGLGISETFLAAGANVFICGRNEPEALPSYGDKVAEFASVDIRDPLQTQSFVDGVVESSGRLDILVNNAGGSPPLEAAKAGLVIVTRSLAQEWGQDQIRINAIVAG